QEQQSAATVKPPIRLWEELNQQAKKIGKNKRRFDSIGPNEPGRRPRGGRGHLGIHAGEHRRTTCCAT
ncbi:MAG TPA: hypothetical protein VNW96_11765, partial [Mycobacterium sp.]|nr:hypothetical protein [Mycobacterium sp.]